MKDSIKNSIQMLLFHYPLYKYMNSDSNIRVLAFGWNNTIESFADSVLTVGQIPGHKLQITICSSNPFDHSCEYVDKRPALEEFVDVKVNNSDLSDSVRHYASLRFCETQECLSELRGTAHDPDAFCIPRYIFIAVEKASETKKLLEELAFLGSRCDAENQSMLITSAQEDMILIKQGESCQQLCEELYPAEGKLSLQEMAFNAHLVWFLQANNDIQAEWNRFTAPDNNYNLLSSQSFALSIPYKLWSAGIVFDNPEHAADEFKRKLEEDKEHALLYQLMDMEQRRWVMEKVTAGYESSYHRGAPTVFEQFVENASVKSPKAHICIQHSEASTPLDSDWYQKNNHQHWDIPNSEDDKLDDLDRMSIDLHRFMKEKANALRDNRFVDSNPAIQAIGTLLHTIEDQASKTANGRVLPRFVNPLRTEYNRFIFCIRAILDGSGAYAKQYDIYEVDFLHAFEKYASAQLPQAKEHLQSIRHDLFPAIEANQYRNYKQNYKALVQYIPFVLTYKRLQRLAVPFSAAAQRTNINDLIFTNVASPMVIKPGLLLYLYQVEPAVNPDTFDSMLRSCLSFLNKNKVPCVVHLAISMDSSISPSKRMKWLDNLSKLTAEHLIDNLIVYQENQPETFFLKQMTDAKVTLYDGTAHLFSSGYKQVQWLEQIRTSVGYFEMVPATKHFYTTDSSRWLTHIYDTSFLRIDDMFTLLNCENKEYDYPDCTEYVFMDDHSTEPEPLFLCLWRIYTGEATKQTRENAVFSWNSLCNVLDPLNTSKVGGAGRLDKGKVKFKLIANADPDKAAAGFIPFKKKEVGTAEKILEKIGGMYSYTGDKLLNVTYDTAGRVNTIEATRDSIVKILSKAGTILEVYCYYRALETGYFDDIACSCTFYWGDQELVDSQRKNEIDLILTKGFQTIIAECKATVDLTQDYFHKLNTISDLFGINARKILIANTYSSNQDRGRRNQEQISRGELMDILTIYKKEEIAKIGTKLASLMRRY